MPVSIQEQYKSTAPASALDFISLIDLSEDVRNPGSFFELLPCCEDVPYDVKVALAVHAAEGLADFVYGFTIIYAGSQDPAYLTRSILTDNGFEEFVKMADSMPGTALQILNSGRHILGFDRAHNRLVEFPFLTMTPEQVA